MFNNKKIKELEERIKKLEGIDVEKDGKKWFASKLTQTLVYGAAGIILVAAANSFVGGVSWLM